jgi:Fe-S cluster assembly protein SufD
VVAGSLADAIEDDGLEPLLGALLGDLDLPFARLTEAAFRDGVIVRVPDGVDVEEPILVHHESVPGDGPSAALTRLLVTLGRGSRATVVESYGSRGGPALVSALTEIHVDESARLEHLRVEDEAEATHHLATVLLRAGRSARAATRHVALGRGLVRGDLHAVLAGEDAEVAMTGLYVGSEKRHVDFHTTIDHAVPHCRSDERFKGVLADEATGVFRGRIIVREDAQKTDAKQTNRNLLLSDRARANTRPQLEIYADDVRCTHGATTGRLDGEALFYLRTRGIGEADARSLLTAAFAREILAELPDETRREDLERRALSRLPGLGSPGGRS